MGAIYGDVVRKCLRCGFGRGEDLNQPALQEGVYQAVICPLRRLEDKFRELQIGSEN